MSQYDNLKAAIAANVYENHNNQVTANMVKAAMNAMVDSLGAGYQYIGIATPTTAPGTPDQKVFYIAAQPGTYPNFGTGITVNDGEVAILKWDTAWHKEVTGAATTAQVTELGQEISSRIDVQDGRLEEQDNEIADFKEAVQSQVNNYPMITINGNVANAPDEEDLTSVEENGNDVLKFKNRSALDGMGYVILRKGGSNTFANQVTAANTIYEIRYDFDLRESFEGLELISEFDYGGIIYYSNEEPIAIKANQAIWVPDDCVVLNEDRDTLLSVNSSYKSTADENVYIACTESKTIGYALSGIVEIPAGCVLRFNGGRISGAFLAGQNTTIIAGFKQIFTDVLLAGDFTNDHIVVEWWGCSVDNTGANNKDALQNYIIPSAVTLKANVFHSNVGEYKIQGAYPLGGTSDTQRYLNNIRVYGRGPETIIRGIVHDGNNPGDVFNLPNTHDLIISDLSVTSDAAVDTQSYGTNAFSLVWNVSNIIIERVRVYDMPYNKLSTYPEGGKAFTIQSTAGNSVIDIIVRDCYAENVSFGVDLTKTSYSSGDVIRNVQFVGNSINGAVCGFYCGGTGTDVSNPRAVVVSHNAFNNCQHGAYASIAGKILFSNNVITNLTQYAAPQTYYTNYVEGLCFLSVWDSVVENNLFIQPYCDYGIHIFNTSRYPQYVSYIPARIIVANNIFKGNPTHYALQAGDSFDTYNVSKYYFNEGIIYGNVLDADNDNNYPEWMTADGYLADNFFTDEKNVYATASGYSWRKHSSVDLYNNLRPTGWTPSSAYITIDGRKITFTGAGVTGCTFYNTWRGTYTLRITYEDFTAQRLQVRYVNSGVTKTLVTYNASSATPPPTSGTFELPIIVEASSFAIYLEGFSGTALKITNIEILPNKFAGDMYCTGLTIDNVPIFTGSNFLPRNSYFGTAGKVFSDKTGHLRIINDSISASYGETRPSNLALYDTGLVFFDTSLSPARPIWWNGSAWVDATGQTV